MNQKVLSTTGPEPVTLEEAKRQCFVTSNSDDGLIDRLIKAARAYAENETWRAITPGEYLAFSDGFPDSGEIEIPRPPLISVEKIEYRNTDDQMVTMDESDYEVDKLSEPGRIRPVNSWPSTKRDSYNTVQITYKAGYAENNAPEGIKHAILMMVKHFYDNPEAVVVNTGSVQVNEVPLGVDALLGHESARTFI